MTDLGALQPALSESNMLCKLFFENVNPFMKILHPAQFGKELGQFRRGDFMFPQEYEALLFCVYLLAVNSLRSELVERTFSTAKQVLVARFKHAAQLSLSRINFVTTDRIIVLQALLHYLVRISLSVTWLSWLPFPVNSKNLLRSTMSLRNFFGQNSLNVPVRHSYSKKIWHQKPSHSWQLLSEQRKTLVCIAIQVTSPSRHGSANSAGEHGTTYVALMPCL